MQAKGTKHARESAAVSDCTKISCVRKVREPRIRKLSAYEIFWIYSKWLVGGKEGDQLAMKPPARLYFVLSHKKMAKPIRAGMCAGSFHG